MFVLFYRSIYFTAAVRTCARNNPAIELHLHIFVRAAMQEPTTKLLYILEFNSFACEIVIL